MGIEQGDLVNLSGVDETPWRVIEYAVGLDKAGEKAKEINPIEQTLEIDSMAESYSVVALATNSENVRVLPTSKVKEPHESAWFLTT